MMNQRINFYEILGLTKEATAEEIKRQFRKLVRKYHPDVAGEDPETVKKFAEIRQAYEILSDPEKRELYDNPPTIKRVKRQIHRKTWRPPKNQSFGTPSSSRKRNWQRPENQVSLDEMFSIPRKEEKQTSRGSNQHVYNRMNAKKGDDIQIQAEVLASVAQRGGSIMVEYRRMIRGDHLELHPLNEIHMLRIPPGTRDGQELRVEKYGHAGGNGGPYGDLICKIAVIVDGDQFSHSKDSQSSFKNAASNQREQSDPSIMSLRVSIPEAVLGGRVPVQTPQGKVMISIPPGSSSGRKFRLRGKGVDNTDLTIELQIMVPDQLDAESIELIRQFAVLNPISPRD